VSADRVGERCPECGDFTLREYYGIHLVKQEALGVPHVVRLDYTAQCRECLFKVESNRIEGSLRRVDKSRG
jgi:hypothetical protein